MLLASRIVNLQAGSIVIDGHDIAKMGLEVLRSRLALVPQDSTLFLGTLRENLCAPRFRNCTSSNSFARDPQATRTDAEIISALKRAWLLPREGSADPATEAKFSLDSSVSDEGMLWVERVDHWLTV